jgi:hypothetical protein
MDTLRRGSGFEDRSADAIATEKRTSDTRPALGGGGTVITLLLMRVAPLLASRCGLPPLLATALVRGAGSNLVSEGDVPGELLLLPTALARSAAVVGSVLVGEGDELPAEAMLEGVSVAAPELVASCRAATLTGTACCGATAAIIAAAPAAAGSACEMPLAVDVLGD